jgi:hypothetical protein
MKTQTQKTVNKVVKKETTNRAENVIVSNGVNLLKLSEKNTKEFKKADTITEKQKEKNAKAEQKEVLKRTKTERKQLGENITFDWLNDTQSKTALEKWIKNNSNKVEKYIDTVNLIHNSNVKITQVNKQLFKFGHVHELNKVDLDGNIIASKEFFNIKFMITYDNSLLNRFAKYGNNNTNEFIKYSQKATENHLQSKYDNKVKKISLILGFDNVENLIDSYIKENKTITKQQIVNKLTELLD